MRHIAVLYAYAILVVVTPASYADGFQLESQIRQVSYLSYTDPHFSTQNPNNNFLSLNRYQFRAELRPDFYLNTLRFKFMLKPRFIYQYNWGDLETSQNDNSGSGDDSYVNESLIQYTMTPNLFVSYGRENLQWGPSYLRTPSNPFFRDNGRDNPKIEINGKDFLKGIYLPNDWLTISIISNFQQGGLRPETQVAQEDFAQTNALKLDFVSANYHSSVILSRKEGDNTVLGGYVQGTVSDALIVYFDGTVNRGNTILYPKLDAGLPLGGSFVRQYKNSDALRFVGLAGASYTMANSATLSFEYLYNGSGYNESDADNYYYLRRTAANNINNSALSPLARSNLNATLDPGTLLLRQHYLFAQYAFNEMASDLSYTLRWTYNLDDQSGSITAAIEYAYNDNQQLFIVADSYSGKEDSEFTSLLRRDFMVGYEYTF